MNQIPTDSEAFNQLKIKQGGILLASVALILSGCSEAPASSSSSTYVAPPTAPELSEVSTAQSRTASKLVYALSRGGNGTAMDYVSPSVGFHYKGVMFALDGCQQTSNWYSPGTSSVISGELTCRDGDTVAVDVTFDANDRVTKVLGQGAARFFDSTVTTNRTY